MNNSFLELVKDSFVSNWDRPALTDVGTNNFFLFKDYAREIAELQILLEVVGVEKGDKVAICGRNSSHWVITFFATLSYGAVPTTILQDFVSESIYNIVNHSEAKVLFVGEAVLKRLETDKMAKLASIVLIEDFSLVKSDGNLEAGFNKSKALDQKYPAGFKKENMFFHEEDPEELAVLNYTSGTTSSPKGVMIPYRSIWSNLKFGIDNIPFVKTGDGMVCMLPMAHMYGLAFEVLLSTTKGCFLHILTKTPSPQVLISTFAEVKPTLVIAVPLIIEKIIRNKVFPELEKQPAKTLLKLPVLKNIVYKKVRETLISTFGGNVEEVIVGGASLSKDVGDFLMKIKFPYLVGYGMTECGPLVTYVYWENFKPGSCGQLVDRLEGRIDSENPETVAGEILVRGANVMLGYFKSPEATKYAIDKDGWLHTGDLGVIDKDGFVFIRGRSKTMILGSSGQNIYPEEIEDLVNRISLVEESLIVEEGHKLKALIFPNEDYVKTNHLTEEKVKSLLDEEIKRVNKNLPSYSQIVKFEVRDTEFEKTPKRSIKRFLYQN